MFPLLGSIFFDPGFRFPDGQRGRKLFIELGRSPAADYITARTTSNPTHKSWKYGCHNDEPEPSFFIPASLKVFPEDTWVCLDYLADLDAKEFEAKVAAGDIRKMGVMPTNILKDLIECAAGAEDTTQMQARVLRDVLAEL